MSECWQESPAKRPTFEEMDKKLHAVLKSLSEEVSNCS